jgi:hypothetical protein
MLALGVGVAVPAVQASLGPHGISIDPCRTCHETASGSPTIRGWSGGVPAGVTGPWAARTLSVLCYMCHETTQLHGAHDMSANAYAAGSHGNVFASVPKDPDGSPQTITTTLPYGTLPNLECTSCHNVHRYEDRPYSNRATVALLCNECHAGRMNPTPLRGAANTRTLGGRTYSTHPTTVAVVDTARANLKALADVQATNLAKVVAAAPAYALGGHLVSPTGDSGALDCGTCHAVHGPAQGTPGLLDLLAINNATGASGSALCNGCHEGGAGSANGVGAINPSDHPIEDAVGTAFYPVGAALPTNWTVAGGQVDRGAQPFFTTGVTGTPACSSCHDTHGGVGGTALLRGPLPTAVWGVMSYDDWCFACHAAAAVLPPAHHSVSKNLATPADPIDSQLSCGDCHGPAGTTNWTAHNGFWAWPVPVADHTSGLCLACHAAADPTDLVAPALKGQTFNESGTIFPSRHGTVRGSASHYLGPDSNEFAGVALKLDQWTGGVNPGYFSTYGGSGATGGGSTAPTGTDVICESCHSVLWNDGRVNPASYPSASTLKSGWQSNLLLERYEDDPPGTGTGTGANAVGSALCTGCHKATGNHHPQTGELVPLSGLPLRTGPGSFADQTSAPVGGGLAPGTLSYPIVNALDCDSCHRPHSADTDSDVSAAAHGSGTSVDGRPTRHILEVDGTGHRYSDLCAECHLQ